jgi:hypothetical protein
VAAQPTWLELKLAQKVHQRSLIGQLDIAGTLTTAEVHILSASTQLSIMGDVIQIRLLQYEVV